MDVEQAGRKIWLIKVPGFVAKRWKGICEQSVQDGAVVGPKLASITYQNLGEAGGGGSSGAQLQLTLDNELTKGIPQQFEMRTTTQNTAPMLAFSMERGGSIAAEGKIHQKFDLEVARRTPAAPAGPSGSKQRVEIDPEYLRLSRERHQAAAVKSRTVQYMKDTRLVGAPTTVAIGQKRKQPGDKRIALDAGVLTTELFRLFERQPRWSFPQLQKHTDQPTGHLKAVLSQIAVQNKRGPYRDMWELQKGYRTQEPEAAALPLQQQQPQQQ